jgi:hypothetical protein
MIMRMTASDGILLNLVVPEPGTEGPACPWGLLVKEDPCDGHGCPLCRAAETRIKKEKS